MRSSHLKKFKIMREETRCHHIRLATRVLLYTSSNRQDSTYHILFYTSCGALSGTRNSSMGPPHEGSIRRPITPWANALTTELHLAPLVFNVIQLDGRAPSVWMLYQEPCSSWCDGSLDRSFMVDPLSCFLERDVAFLPNPLFLF